MSTPLLTALLFLPLASALVPLPARRRRVASYAAVSVPAVQLFMLLSLWPEVREGGRLLCSWNWLPELDLYFSLALDGLSWLFASLIAGVGILVFVYSASYLRDDPHLTRLYRLLLLFNGAMMGVVLADNLILLAVFWELTSISSFLLIGFHFERLLTETNGPFTQISGRPSRPADVSVAVQALAHLRCADLSAITASIIRNLRELVSQTVAANEMK